jgi:hypothetical protein
MALSRLSWGISFLENYQWWFKFNIWFCGMFPSWPGETYWVLRKPK